MWFDEVSRMYAGTETKNKYIGYNNRFIEWLKSKNFKTDPQEKDVRDYIDSEFITKGKDSSMVIAALRFRFNYCEKN